MTGNSSFDLYFGKCSVVYEGRASSRLDEGERITLVRPSVVTVHALDDRVNPINYMKEATTTVEDETITAVRSNPDEKLVVDFSRLDKQITYDASDDASLNLTGTEDELQERLYNNPSMINPDFKSHSREYLTGAGPVDIKGDIDGTVTLVEVKKHADISAVSQLARYLKANNSSKGIIASHSINKSVKQTLTEYPNIEYVQV